MTCVWAPESAGLEVLGHCLQTIGHLVLTVDYGSVGLRWSPISYKLLGAADAAAYPLHLHTLNSKVPKSVIQIQGGSNPDPTHHTLKNAFSMDLPALRQLYLS